MTTLLAALFLAAAVLVFAAGRRIGRWCFAVAAVPLMVAFVASVGFAVQVLDGEEPARRFTWVQQLSLSFTFRVDAFAAVMALLVSGIGLLVLVYAASYFAHDPSPARVVRFVGADVLFAGAMFGLVTAGDVWTLFVFWELTSLTSFLLIGLDDDQAGARVAAQRALLVTGAAGLAMLGGVACLVQAAGTSDLAGVLHAAPRSTSAQVGVALVLVGAFAKSAQVPLHFWLPGAMAAPTPVSAYLHSATMVKAGVVFVARLAPAFAVLGWWRPVLVCTGGLTMLLGGVAALRRYDAKQSLAYGTVSQLGLLIVVFGAGQPALTAAGVALLVAHAIFKSALFLAIGAVDHATGTRDLRRLTGVGRELPVLTAAAGLCTLSMIGVPPLLGFAAKESVLAGLSDAGGAWLTVALLAVVAGSVLTTAYSIRLWWGMFASNPQPVGEPASVHHRPSPVLVAPVVLLAALSLVAGLAAGPLGDRLAVAGEALDEDAHLHLTLWAGVNRPLVLSVAIIAAGSVLGWVVMRRGLPAAPSATVGERVYSRALNGLLAGARRLTLVTQSGSLPVYIAIVFSVVAMAIGVALATGAGGDWGDPVLADSGLQAAVALLGVVIAVAVVLARRRFVSVLLLGGIGQCLTVLFLMYGAPDLALTQFMVETLSIVAFVLVLRHLPRHFSPRPAWVPRALRIGIAAVVGVTMAWFALVAGSVDRPTDVTDAVEELSLPEAGGRNVVNVVIVDFRGIDTMGEITVFGLAALGVANLVTASRRRTGYRGEVRLAKIGAESMIFEQVTRMIFHLTLLVSLYVTLRGHNAPGGGFAGGLIAGCAFVFRLLAGGSSNRPAVSRISPVVLIPVGMLLAIGTGLAALIAGNEFLESSVFHVHPPLIGDVKLVSAGVFDLGVYLLVIGVVIIVLSHLASRTHAGGTMRERPVQS